MWIDDPPTAVIKHTLPGFYGRTLDEDELLDPSSWRNCRKLTLRPALPSEYLRRWAIIQALFGLPSTYLGRTNASEPCMAISQPFIGQDPLDPPTVGDVEQFMTAHGFAKVDPGKVALPEIADVTWYRQKDGILITDTYPRNFRKDVTEGAIIPVDLMVTMVPKGVSKILPDPDEPWSPAVEE